MNGEIPSFDDEWTEDDIPAPTREASEASDAVMRFAELVVDGQLRWRLLGLSDALSEIPATPPDANLAASAYLDGYRVVYPFAMLEV